MKLRAMIDAHRNRQNFRKQKMNVFDGKGLPAVEVISLQKFDGVPLYDERKQKSKKKKKKKKKK